MFYCHYLLQYFEKYIKFSFALNVILGKSAIHLKIEHLSEIR